MLRKINMLLIIATIFLGLFITQVVHANEAIINADNLNVRGGPGSNFNVVGQIHMNETYPIIQQNGEWIEIQLQDASGWVSTDYITIKGEHEESTPSTPTNEEKIITIPYEHTQIRNGPSTEYKIIHFANKGDEFTVIAETDEWYEIQDGSVEGFVLKQLVDNQQGLETGGFQDKTIVIDAGHGGRDVGAIGANETYEKQLTSKTANELASQLSRLGADVILTRQKDEYIFLNSRSSIANNSIADAFISIHYNSVPELPDVKGVGTYYYQDQNEELANYIQQGIINTTGANDRKSTYGDFQVIRLNYIPAVLLELGFISNSEEELLLMTNSYQQKMVNGIMDGLGKYFSN